MFLNDLRQVMIFLMYFILLYQKKNWIFNLIFELFPY